MKELNFQPAHQQVPEGFFRRQKEMLMQIPVAENARRRRLRTAFFSSAAIIAGAVATLFYPGLSGPNVSAEENIDAYFSQASDVSLQHTIYIADCDPFLELY